VNRLRALLAASACVIGACNDGVPPPNLAPPAPPPMPPGQPIAEAPIGLDVSGDWLVDGSVGARFVQMGSHVFGAYWDGQGLTPSRSLPRSGVASCA
jgi:hypothetical protein